MCSCVAKAYCAHTCSNVYYTCTYVHWVLLCSHCSGMCISYVYIVLCCAAGIKKYIVGLVIKLSSDPESAEVNFRITFGYTMPCLYAH